MTISQIFALISATSFMITIILCVLSFRNERIKIWHYGLTLAIGFVFLLITWCMPDEAKAKQSKHKMEMVAFDNAVVERSLREYDAIVKYDTLEPRYTKLTIYKKDNEQFYLAIDEHDFPIDLMTKTSNSYIITHFGGVETMSGRLIIVGGDVTVYDNGGNIIGRVTITEHLGNAVQNIMKITFVKP